MAKKSKGKLATRKERQKRTRQERRFIPNTSTRPVLVYVIGWVSAILLGAGAWGAVYAQSLAEDAALKSAPNYLIAVGAVVLGVAIWLGTASESVLRIGDPGIAMEKGELRRMPWWGVEKISFDPGALAILVVGTDEMGTAWTLKLQLRSHAEAIGWIVRQAQERIPKRLDIDEETLEKLPQQNDRVGEKVELEPLQVVGKRCAASGKIISYEPDARVCRRCERVYFKTSVPKKCKCGNSLADLRPKDAQDPAGDEAEEADEHEHEHEHGREPSEKSIEAAEG
jgi:hypothetical protein